MRLAKTLRALSTTIGLLLVPAMPVAAGTIGVRWDPVPAAAGYRVSYGTAPGDYSDVVDVGNVRNVTLNGLIDCTTYFVAIKAYNPGGESLEFSNEVSGWARPEVTAFEPRAVRQGERVTVNIDGRNFEPGAELIIDAVDLPRDHEGRPLIALESIAVLSCTRIQAMLAVDPDARGFRAMEVGELMLSLEVRNPDSVFGSRATLVEVSFDPFRSDINRSDASTRDRVDGKDLIWLSYAYAAAEGEPRYNPDADLDGDGEVDGDDLAYLASAFGSCWTEDGWNSDACP